MGTIGTLERSNNSQARDVEIALDFLGKGDYKVTLYKDARDTDTNPNHLIKEL